MTPPGLRLVDTPRLASQALSSAVLIGSYPPRRCGIATFTADVRAALMSAKPDLRCDVFAMNDEGGPYDYPSEVSREIQQQEPASYHAAAAHITELQPDVIFVQHEFGIFGGEAGEHLLLLLEATDRPVVTMMHTILDKPTSAQRRVCERLLARSSQVVVMSGRGQDMLRAIWNVPKDKISVVPHGAPDRPLVANDRFKAQLGFEGRDLLFTFGLLSPNKGIEHAIRALPAIAKARPQVLYAVLGATHPHLIAHQGEQYRDSLMALATDLGVQDHLRLIDEYTDTGELVKYLQAADVYVTPYLNPVQITSGTLSYAAALGCPIVSTPYWHAEDLLSDGSGRLAPFGDSEAIAREVTGLLVDDAARQALRERIYAKGRDTIWSRFAERVLGVLGEAAAASRRAAVLPGRASRPGLSLGGVQRMTDSCGMLQHSLFAVPDRRHGYCVDDNARALLLMQMMPGPMTAERRRLTCIYATFVQHAWNSDRGRFRNFMSYERQWLEAEGSEDSTARAFWSVAATVANARETAMRRWAEGLVGETWPHMRAIASPRANAFILLGLSALIEAGWGGADVKGLAREKLEGLRGLIDSRAATGEPWFEDVLAYDNARLPEALIRAGLVLGDREAIEIGAGALKWLTRRQSTSDGLFLPVATADFGKPLTARTLFDQQPVEAAATLDACEAAFLATADRTWVEEGERAFAWFFGTNTLGVSLAAPDGECFDGLTWDGPNENQGAESVLALQLATCTYMRITAIGEGSLKTAADR
ncbi:MAG TPA: glycosyltransferase family 4 protein [Caulobacteraceae bacterium]|nr:glycosyltransferase family 4 protein [Caulobacteraceae bacterium]